MRVWLCLLLLLLLFFGGRVLPSPAEAPAQEQFQPALERLELLPQEEGLRLRPREENDPKALADVQRLEALFQRYPGLEQELCSLMEAAPLQALSFTQVPLAKQGGHWLQVPAAYEAEAQGSFLLYTALSGGTEPFHDGWAYWAHSGLCWDLPEGSAAEAPSGSEDRLLQFCPEGFMGYSADLAACYSDDSAGDCWQENGGSNWLQFALNEAPAKACRLESCRLSSLSSGPRSREARRLQSCYVHLWEPGFVTALWQEGPDVSASSSSGWRVWNTLEIDF